jgi:hypothetical protein
VQNSSALSKYALQADSTMIDLAGTVNRTVDEVAGTRPQWCMVAEMKHFIGLTYEVADDVLGIVRRKCRNGASGSSSGVTASAKRDEAREPSAG